MAPVNNLSELLCDLEARSSCEKSDANVLAIFGIHSVFSNFHQAPFVIDNITYLCSEQYIQSTKAALFDDDETNAAIIMSTNPFQMKRLGNRVRNYERSKWESNAKPVAVKAVCNKFQQNDTLKQILLHSHQKIVETSRDPYWETGIVLNEKGALQVQMIWYSCSLMSEVYDTVKDLLK